MSELKQEAMPTGENNAAEGTSRRGFMKMLGLGGISLAGMINAPIEDVLAESTSKVNRYSSPTDLKITDMRIAEITGVVFRTPIVRIYTNQGIVGHGDVRDGAAKEYALMLKSRLLGENPCNVERLFKKIRQFGHHARQGGGVSGVEMALWSRWSAKLEYLYAGTPSNVPAPPAASSVSGSGSTHILRTGVNYRF